MAFLRSRLVLRWTAALALLASLVLAAVPASAADGWAPGPFAAGDNTYTGYIDWPPAGRTIATNESFVINGWVVDTTAQGWAGIDAVDIYLGKAGEGGTLLAHALFALPRPDVGMALNNNFWSASGWVVEIPAGALPLGQQTLSVYAHTPSKGWWFKQVTVNVSRPVYNNDPLIGVDEPKENDKVLTDEDYTIKGYAIDRNAPFGTGWGVNRVQIYLGGPRDAAGSWYLGDAILGEENATPAQYGTQFNKGGWKLTFEPTKWHADWYNLYVYARSSVTGKETLKVVRFEINEP